MKTATNKKYAIRISGKKNKATPPFLRRFLLIKEDAKPLNFLIQCLLYCTLVYWGLSFFGKTDFSKNPFGPSDSILHNVNTIFHEAGHWIFSPFGRFLHIFGGTLLQCLMPLLAIGQFLRQRDNFSASVGLWWFAQNLFDVAPYIYDAWDMKLPLLGGGTGTDHPATHDWYNLLKMTNTLQYYSEISGFVVLLGKLFFLCSFLWGGAILYKKFCILKKNYG